MNLIYRIISEFSGQTTSFRDPGKAGFISDQLFDTLESSLPLLKSVGPNREKELERFIEMAGNFVTNCPTSCECYISAKLGAILTKAGIHEPLRSCNYSRLPSEAGVKCCDMSSHTN